MSDVFTFSDDQTIAGGIRKNVNRSLPPMLARLFSGAQIGDELKNMLNAADTYIARIPSKLQAGMKNGTLHFMLKKGDGTMLGPIVNEKGIVQAHPIIEIAPRSAQGVLSGLSGLAMQQQLCAMAENINEVRKQTAKLIAMHDDDLLGALRGAKDSLINLANWFDPDSGKNIALQTIRSLDDTRGKILQRLLGIIKSLPDVPEHPMTSLSSYRGLYSSMQSGYRDAQNMFSAYLLSDQLLAYAYAFLGEKKQFYHVFVPDSSLMSLPLRKKINAAGAVLDPKELSAPWYQHPAKFLGKISKEAERLFLPEPDCIIMKATGQQLLSAIASADAPASDPLPPDPPAENRAIDDPVSEPEAAPCAISYDPSFDVELLPPENHAGCYKTTEKVGNAAPAVGKILVAVLPFVPLIKDVVDKHHPTSEQ